MRPNLPLNFVEDFFQPAFLKYDHTIPHPKTRLSIEFWFHFMKSALFHVFVKQKLICIITLNNWFHWFPHWNITDIKYVGGCMLSHFLFKQNWGHVRFICGVLTKNNIVKDLLKMNIWNRNIEFSKYGCKWVFEILFKTF